MTKPPIPSVVLRTPKPTPAQAALIAAQRPQPSGTTIFGMPAHLPKPTVGPKQPPKVVIGRDSLGAPIYGDPPTHIQTDAHGLVANPAAPNLRPPKAPAKPAPKPRMKVMVHPDGRIEVTHMPAPAADTTNPGVNLGAASKGGKYQTDSQGRTDTTMNRRPVATPRVPATTAAAPTTAPLTVEQQAQNLLDPVKQSILDAINGRVAAQQAAITNYAKDLASMMGQYSPDAKADFGNAETGQAAIDAALAQTLQVAGTSGEAGLAAKLAQIDADPGTAARINGAAQANTQGAVGAAAGRGAASLSQLVGEGANAADYGAKFPTLAGLYGLQATKSAQSQGTTDAANAVAQIEQQLPSVVQTLKTDTNQNKQLRFEHGVALLQANGGVVTPTIKALLGGALPVGKTQKTIDTENAATKKIDPTLSKAYSVQMNALGQAILGPDGKPIPYPSGGQGAPKVDLALSDRYHILVDAQAQPILRNGKPVELPSASTSTGKYRGLTAAKYQTEQAKAAGLARIAHEPTADGHPPVTWQQYLTGTLKQGVPWWIAIQEGKRVYTPAEIRLGLIPGQKK